MSHTFKVLHIGGQCPWFWWTLEQIQQAATQLQGKVEILDVGNGPELDSRYRLFFPFMVVIDDMLRWSSPVTAEGSLKLVQDPNRPSAIPRVCILHPPAQASKIVELTLDNIEAACVFCLPGADAHAIHGKREWVKRYGEAIVGYLAYEGELVVGGIEYLCASQIPFPLPEKRDTAAFITCLYSMEGETEDVRDYRREVLDYALTQLPGQGYQCVQVIAGRRCAYPNGPRPYLVCGVFGK